MEGIGVSIANRAERTQVAGGLTNASCTAPQKHVAVASSSLDQPSPAHPASGMYGSDLSAEAAIAVGVAVSFVINCAFSTWFLVL